MIEKKLICIECPRGCELTIALNNNIVSSVTGNFCPKGAAYARQEVVNPSRIVTSSVRLSDSEMISVKTDNLVPKSLIFDVMQQINTIKATAPVKIGDVLLKNVCGTNSNIVATKNSQVAK